MNEKWCSDTLDKIIKEAEVRRIIPRTSIHHILTRGMIQDTTDLMTDISLDTRATESRHRKSRTKKIVTLAHFPTEWLSESNAFAQQSPELGVEMEIDALTLEAESELESEATREGEGKSDGW